MVNLIVLAGMLGAGCTDIAKRLSDRLGLDYINTEKVLRKAVVEGELSYQQLEKLVHSGEINIEKLIRSMVLDYVAEGKVIIEGRSAFQILDRPADIKVFLYATKDFRAERISERRKIGLDEARRAVEESDNDRLSLVRRLYDRDWMDPSLYTVIINTAELGIESTAELIIRLVNMLGKR